MYEHREENLVEAEALGRVGQDVGVNRVRGVRGPVGDRIFLGGQGLHDAAQPREHGQSAVLQFLDLQLFQVTRFGQGQRVESATRGDIPDGEFVKDRVNHASSVRFGTANQDGFDDQNVPEGRVARAFRRQRGDGARELVRDGGAVIRGAQGTRGEPRDAGAVFGGPGASDAQHGPSAVDDFTLGVLFVAERDDRGFAPTRVGTEFRVDVSLDNLGDGLGLYSNNVGRKKEGTLVSLKNIKISKKFWKRKEENRRKILKTTDVFFQKRCSLASIGLCAFRMIDRARKGFVHPRKERLRATMMMFAFSFFASSIDGRWIRQNATR